MQKSRLFTLALVWAVSLVGVGLWARTADTQGLERRATIGPNGQIILSESVQAPQQVPQAGDIMSGADVGFRVSGVHVNRGVMSISGTWMIRFNGQWIETGGGPMLQPAGR